MIRIGLISDTHGLLRPEAVEFLSGCQAILHAGDIGDGSILAALSRIAPVTAVRGNNDVGPWAEDVPEFATLVVDGVTIRMLHDVSQIGTLGASVRVVISGHSHKPLVSKQGGVLFANPGSAGPRRFKLPVSVGELLIDGAEANANVVELPVG